MMLLTIEDLEAAAAEVSQFVVRLQEPGGLEQWVCDHLHNQRQAVSERVVASSGVLIQLAVYKKEQDPIPQEVMLCLSKPPLPVPLSLEASMPEECVEESARMTPINAIAEHEEPPRKRPFRGIREQREEFCRQEAAAFRRHVFWPGGKALSPRKPPGPVCPGCRWKFERRPSSPDQEYCCSRCAQRKAKTAHHDKECRRFGEYKGRKLRLTIRDPVPGKPLDSRENRVAGGEEAEGIFLQLAIYAARAGMLSKAEEDKVRDRFSKHFKSVVGKRSFVLRQDDPKNVVRTDILSKAWTQIKKTYRNPDRADDGFTRYVRRRLRQLAYPSYDRDFYVTTPFDEEKHSGQRPSSVTSSSPPDRPSPRAAAAWTDLKQSTMYDLIAKGVVLTSKDGGKTVLLPGWWDSIQQWKKTKDARDEKALRTRTLASALEKQRGIAPESAVRQVNDWLQEGKTVQGIKELIGENEVRAAFPTKHGYICSLL